MTAASRPGLARPAGRAVGDARRPHGGPGPGSLTGWGDGRLRAGAAGLCVREVGGAPARLRERGGQWGAGAPRMSDPAPSDPAGRRGVRSPPGRVLRRGGHRQAPALGALGASQGPDRDTAHPGQSATGPRGGPAPAPSGAPLGARPCWRAGWRTPLHSTAGFVPVPSPPAVPPARRAGDAPPGG